MSQIEIERSRLPNAHRQCVLNVVAVGSVSAGLRICGKNRTVVTALRWPTKSIFVLHLFRSMTCAVGAPLFMACAEIMSWPSGDQLSLRTCVVPVHCLNGPSITFSRDQSRVFHILSVLSSDWEAKKVPTGSQATPLTRPACALILWIMSYRIIWIRVFYKMFENFVWYKPKTYREIFEHSKL